MIKSNLKHLITLFFSVGFFLIPLFFLPNSLVEYEVPKVKFFLVWSSFLFVLSYFVLLFVLKLKIELPKRFLVAFFMLLILFVASFFGVDFKRSFFGNFYRWDGLVTLMSLLSFSFSIYVLKRVVDIEKLVFFSVFLSFMLTFIWCAIQYWLSYSPVYAGFGHPVFLVGYSFALSPFLFYGSGKYFGRKWVKVLLLLMLSTIGVMTGTIFGFLTIPFYILAILFLEKKISAKMLLALVTFIFVIGVGVYLFEQSKVASFVFESRERIVRKSILAFQARPLLGWGYANFDVAFSSVDWPIKVNNDVYMDKAHSHLLEYIVTSGVVGLFSYLVVLFCFTSDLLRPKKGGSDYMILMFMFYMVHSQTNIVGISEEILFWLVFGLVE